MLRVISKFVYEGDGVPTSMFVGTISVPRCRSQACLVKSKDTFCVPGIYDVFEFGREVEAHVHDPSNILSVLDPCGKTCTQSGKSACSAYDSLLRGITVEVFDLICRYRQLEIDLTMLRLC